MIRAVFVVHAIITLLAGVVLVVSPGLIPRTAGVTLEPGAYLMAYLLAGAELGIAALSFGAARVREPAAVRLVATGFAVFHGSTALLEGWVLVARFDPTLAANVVARVVIVGLFVLVRRRAARV